MIVNNENKLIELIKNKKTLPAIKESIEKKQIEWEQWDFFFKDTLFYLINENTSFEIIRFIIEQHQQQQDINYTDIVFHAINCNNFKVAKLLLLKYGISIESLNEKYKNIIEYLRDAETLDSKKLSFIFSNANDMTLINNEVLCKLIELRDFKLLKDIFHYNFMNYHFLKNILHILNIYKNKTPLSDVQLKKKIFINKININKRLKDGDTTPLMYAVKGADMNDTNTEALELLMEYSKKSGMVLNLNETYRNNNYPLLYATNTNEYCFEKLKLLLDYAKENNIVLEINRENDSGFFPLLNATDKNNTEMVRLLINYAKENNIILQINKRKIRRYYDSYPILNAIKHENMEMIKLLLDYAMEYHIPLNIDRNFYRCDKDNMKDYFEKYPLLNAVQHKNSEILKLFIEYAKVDPTIFRLYPYNFYKPLLLMLKLNRNVEFIKLLLEFATECHVIININGKDRFYEKTIYPLKLALKNNNTEVVKLLIDYAIKNNITLDLKNISPITEVTRNNNIEIAKLLMAYAKE